MGKVIGDPHDPLLVSVRSGAKFSMPGMMDTVLNLGLNDQSVEGLAKQTGDERFAYDSYRRFIAMYGRIVLGHRRRGVRRAVRRGQGAAPGPARTPSVPTELLRYLADSYQQVVERTHRPALPPGPGGPAARGHRGGLPQLERRRGPSPTASASGIPHTLGTAVNVQAMVFGNRDDRRAPASGSPGTRPPGTKGAYGDFLVNAQGEDVVAGIRNTEPLSALQAAFPKVHTRAARDLRPARAPLPRHVRHRVHHRAGQALDAPDPGGQAHRAGRAAHGRRDDRPSRTIRLTRAEAIGRITEDHLDPVLHPQFAGSGHPVAGPRGWPPRRGRRSAGSTSPPTTPRPPPGGASR